MFIAFISHYSINQFTNPKQKAVSLPLSPPMKRMANIALLLALLFAGDFVRGLSLQPPETSNSFNSLVEGSEKGKEIYTRSQNPDNFDVTVSLRAGRGGARASGAGGGGTNIARSHPGRRNSAASCAPGVITFAVVGVVGMLGFLP